MSDDNMSTRLTLASRLLAGLLSNPAVVTHSTNYGMRFFNVSASEIAGRAVKLADELIAADELVVESGIGKTEEKSEGLVVCDHAKVCERECEEKKPHDRSALCKYYLCPVIGMVVKCVPANAGEK